jgi:hypothetical protein
LPKLGKTKAKAGFGEADEIFGSRREFWKQTRILEADENFGKADENLTRRK